MGFLAGLRPAKNEIFPTHFNNDLKWLEKLKNPEETQKWQKGGVKITVHDLFLG